MEQGSCLLECSCHHSEHLILCPQAPTEHLLRAEPCPSPALSWGRCVDGGKNQESKSLARRVACAPEPAQTRGVGTEVTEEGHV